jgi:adenylate kinase
MNNLKGMSFCFMGKSGAGKGTQLEMFLRELAKAGHSVLPIVSGDGFRRMKSVDSAVGRRVRDVLESGGLMPSWLAAYIWEQEIVEKLKDPDMIIIFDGAPRRIEEAHTIDNVLQWLVRKAVVPIYLDITREEAFRRLKARAREDDTDLAIENRLTWFESEVKPIADWYEEQGRLVRINGMGSTDEVFANLMRSIEHTAS